MIVCPSFPFIRFLFPSSNRPRCSVYRAFPSPRSTTGRDVNHCRRIVYFIMVTAVRGYNQVQMPRPLVASRHGPRCCPTSCLPFVSPHRVFAYVLHVMWFLLPHTGALRLQPYYAKIVAQHATLALPSVLRLIGYVYRISWYASGDSGSMTVAGRRNRHIPDLKWDGTYIAPRSILSYYGGSRPHIAPGRCDALSFASARLLTVLEAAVLYGVSICHVHNISDGTCLSASSRLSRFVLGLLLLVLSVYLLQCTDVPVSCYAPWPWQSGL